MNCGPCCVTRCEDHACTDEVVWLDDCCGNGECEADETFDSCSLDCTETTCGDGVCEWPTETCMNCAYDCGCGAGLQCDGQQCVVPQSNTPPPAMSPSGCGGCQQTGSSPMPGMIVVLMFMLALFARSRSWL